jgi:hypothetical protein
MVGTSRAALFTVQKSTAIVRLDLLRIHESCPDWKGNELARRGQHK